MEGINTEVVYQDLTSLSKGEKRRYSDANSSARYKYSNAEAMRAVMSMVDQTNIIVLSQPSVMVTHDVFLSRKTGCAVSS